MKMVKLKKGVWVAGMLLLLASICMGTMVSAKGKGKKKVPVKRITITAGKQKSLSFKYKGKRISRKKLSCRSSNKKIVTVKKGKIKARKAGKATVTAKYKKSVRKYRITVKAKKAKKTEERSFEVVNQDLLPLVSEFPSLNLKEDSFYGSVESWWSPSEALDPTVQKAWVLIDPDGEPINYQGWELVKKSSMTPGAEGYGVFEGMEKPDTLLGIKLNALSGKKTHYNIDTDAIEKGANVNGSYNMRVDFAPDANVCTTANKMRLIREWIATYQNTRSQLMINYQKDYIQMNVITADIAHSVYISNYGVYEESYAAVFYDRGCDKYQHYGEMESINRGLDIWADHDSIYQPDLSDLYDNISKKYGTGSGCTGLQWFKNLRYYKERGIE